MLKCPTTEAMNSLWHCGMQRLGYGHCGKIICIQTLVQQKSRYVAFYTSAPQCANNDNNNGPHHKMLLQRPVHSKHSINITY